MFRISILKDQKQKQEEDLEELYVQQEVVKEKAEELADKIENVIAHDQQLIER